jgi:hypothetical protein
LCLSVAFKQKGEKVLIRDDFMDDELLMQSPSFSSLDFPIEEKNDDKNYSNNVNNSENNGYLSKFDGGNDDFKKIKIELNDCVIDELIDSSISKIESRFDNEKEEKIIKNEVLDSNDHNKKIKSNFFNVKSEKINDDSTVCENNDIHKEDKSISIDLCSPSSSTYVGASSSPSSNCIANNEIDNNHSNDTNNLDDSHTNNESNHSPCKIYSSLSSSSTYVRASSISSSSSSSSSINSNTNNYKPKTSNNFEGTAIRIPQSNSSRANGDFGSPVTENSDNNFKTNSVSTGAVFGSPGSGGKYGGICVDTHVHKVSKRIGWATGSKDPEGTRKVHIYVYLSIKFVFSVLKVDFFYIPPYWYIIYVYTSLSVNFNIIHKLINITSIITGRY